MQHEDLIQETVQNMQHKELIQEIVHNLQTVDGLLAIVLGGSQASGVQQPDSDIDIGLYYHTDHPLDIAHLRTIAAHLNDTPDPIVTDLGGWGPWVNGGAWLTIHGQRVDWLYRDIDFVAATIDECKAGIVRRDYWQQPAYGFHSHMYCTETVICQPLYDPDHLLAPLKAQVEQYPPKLKQTIIKDYLWQSQFTLENSAKMVARGNIYFVVGALARAIHCLIQVLYALNETYYISEKRLPHDLNTFPIKPTNTLTRIYTLLGAPGTTTRELQNTLTQAHILHQEIAALTKTL